MTETFGCMHLEFVPVEEFYFALTLAVKTLEEISTPGLAEQVKDYLATEFGPPSTIAAATQNTYSYVFRVKDMDNSPNPGLVLSISDWNGNLRLSSDYGWTLDLDRKPIRTSKVDQRAEFAQQMKQYLQGQWQISL